MFVSQPGRRLIVNYFNKGFIMRNIYLISAITVLLAACGSQPPAPEQTPAEVKTSTPTDVVVTKPVVNVVPQPTFDAMSVAALKDPRSPLSKRMVYFDLDSYVVKDEFQSTLAAHSKFLAANAKMKMLIQGNSDERGSRIRWQARRSRSSRLVYLTPNTLICSETSHPHELPDDKQHRKCDKNTDRRAAAHLGHARAVAAKAAILPGVSGAVAGVGGRAGHQGAAVVTLGLAGVVEAASGLGLGQRGAQGGSQGQREGGVVVHGVVQKRQGRPAGRRGAKCCWIISSTQNTRDLGYSLTESLKTACPRAKRHQRPRSKPRRLSSTGSA